jgi:hypothetical protein
MPQFKYLAYLAVVCAVLLDLYGAKPGTSDSLRLGLDVVALVFGVAGLSGIALGNARARRF